MDINQLAPIIEFNFAPASYIDESWLANLPNAQVIQALQAEASSAAWASRHILEAYALHGKSDLDFNRPEKQMGSGQSQASHTYRFPRRPCPERAALKTSCETAGTGCWWKPALVVTAISTRSKKGHSLLAVCRKVFTMISRSTGMPRRIKEAYLPFWRAAVRGCVRTGE